MKYYLIAELREDYNNLLNTENIYNGYVSKKSIDDFVNACCQVGYECEFLGGLENLYRFSKEQPNIKDYVFINFNYGTPSKFKRGQSPIFFEMLKANYSGSDPLTSLIVNDKSFSKKIVKDKVSTPKSILVFSEKDTERINDIQWHFPVIVKPNSEGSSLGISDNSLCDSVEETINISKELLRNFSPVMVEEYIEGFEVTVWIIGNENNYRLIQPLVVFIDNKYYFEKKIFTATDKANHIRNYSLPDSIFSSQLTEKIIKDSLLIFEELGIRDYGRIDFRIKNNEVFFIEANALPFFSKSSEIGEITKLCNISYNSICKMIIDTINTRLNVQN